MVSQIVKSIAGAERGIETLQVLMAMLVDRASPEHDEDATSELAYKLLEAAEDLRDDPMHIYIRLVTDDGSGHTKRLRITFGMTVENFPPDVK